jgi:uncharacterized protein YyaL (SSP411 family)
MNNNQLEALLKLDKTGIPADGGKAYNRLIFSRSPYLLQHAKNPVEWREWGEDAFAEARRRDLPLFISIGYATCHWCHVMAHESFSDSAVAAILNEFYIPVKVDREERPDIDEFYMTAARSLTGSGGWPLNVFIDHQQRPFFAITYLPKEPKYQTPGFMDLLTNIASLWKDKRELLANNAAEICRSVAALAHIPAATGHGLNLLAKDAVNKLAELFDNRFGGFGVAVKFPMPTYLLFLLTRDTSNHPNARSMVIQTLESMMNGGIHDQLGGGFHRYSVDQQWLIPHFEKMLYDQALLIVAYSDAFKVSHDNRFLDTAISTAHFAVNELLTAKGSFCSGLDADSEGEEGLFYTWRYDELEAILGADCSLALEYWGARREGDLDGRCVLHRAVTAETFAAAQAISPEELQRIIATASTRLLAARDHRARPLRDSKVICSWNCLMISALVRLYTVSENQKWLRLAEATAEFILLDMVDSSGLLFRSWLESRSAIPAYAEDYAALTLALAELAATGSKQVWVEKLNFFANELNRLFINQAGVVSFCGVDSEKLPFDIPAVQDGVLPSSVALCAVSLLRAGKICHQSDLIEKGERIIRRYRGIVEKNPAACLSLIMAEETLAERE